MPFSRQDTNCHVMHDCVIIHYRNDDGQAEFLVLPSDDLTQAVAVCGCCKVKRAELDDAGNAVVIEDEVPVDLAQAIEKAKELNRNRQAAPDAPAEPDPAPAGDDTT